MKEPGGHVAPPREFAPGIHWLGGCVELIHEGQEIHSHISAYLIAGSERTMLIDTAYPGHWTSGVAEQLDSVLDGRQLDWIAPTHPELAHAGNMNRLFERYPGSRAIGRLTDYHLFYPESLDRLESWPLDEPIDLGGGYRVRLLEAPIKDLPSTQWAYEESQQVLFVADAFAYIHAPVAGLDEPTHRPGECRLLSTELPSPPSVQKAAYVTKAALAWAQYIDVTKYREQIAQLVSRYPTAMIAPAHGNVIANPDEVEPVIFGAYRMVFDAWHEQHFGAASTSASGTRS
jgi:flavorubredoxin